MISRIAVIVVVVVALIVLTIMVIMENSRAGSNSNSNSSSIVGAGSILSSDLCFSEGPSANSKQNAVAKSINDEITFRGDEDLKEEATEVEKEIEEDSISQQSLNQSCSGKNSSCDDDNDCCDDFICHKRDMICKRQHRQKKVN